MFAYDSLTSWFVNLADNLQQSYLDLFLLFLLGKVVNKLFVLLL
ncbi:hypothetical protein GMES_4469 [Paraglaciecola mesophila KMM 241]|uniref:Uncharacterized protein n=1 Tax=Paraglaciecola mesophila KMM 241 TaxID=1128912 RepID=K6ZTT7_9ALTE|nr:hypothetical protein GMES_4469 [Paraglaciecola mesophila KMM 241]